MVKTVLSERIARIARQRGITFHAAAALAGRSGARKRQKERARLTAVRTTWAWQRDFEA